MSLTENHILTPNITIPSVGRGYLFFIILETGLDIGGLLYSKVEILYTEEGLSAQPPMTEWYKHEEK